MASILASVSDIVDLVLDHSREIARRLDDSVMQVTQRGPMFLRLGFDLCRNTRPGSAAQSGGSNLDTPEKEHWMRFGSNDVLHYVDVNRDVAEWLGSDCRVW